ncbi:putative phospholipid-transporting ATPase 4 [Castilleja foliolosa]|uniref:Phospholipid-transporting ATPase 4 n=1 Tax=Castilleja foliolosa TaxID=1961234 RepID=A0ABD3E669_9LAMI
MSIDFSTAQFRFLERLLVVHGHWCYKRIVQMICYFYYKNIAFGLTIFYFEAFAGFSGQSMSVDWYMLLFNIVLTSLPVISLGVFEQDVDSEVCLRFPSSIPTGPKKPILRAERRRSILEAFRAAAMLWARTVGPDISY